MAFKLARMSDEDPFAFESNGLLDFLPTPPESNEDLESAIPDLNAKSSFQHEKRPASPVLGYGSPPPDFDEEPSDFEDEVRGIMEREKRSMSFEMDVDENESSRPVASCTSLFVPSWTKKAYCSASRPRREVILTPPPEIVPTADSRVTETLAEPSDQFELLPMFESIAPLRVETASGRTVIFKRRAKPRPKPLPVRHH